MTIISWLILGLVAGWIASQVMKGGGYGVVGDLILGVLGAIVGGWLTSLLLGFDLITGFNIESLIVAPFGAFVLIVISRLRTGPRVERTARHAETPSNLPKSFRESSTSERTAPAETAPAETFMIAEEGPLLPRRSPEGLSPPSADRARGIFICYRHDDSAGYAGRLSDLLNEHLGQDQVFMDINTLEPGEDFVEAIENAVGSCAALIAVIGRHWLTTSNSVGNRRLDEPEDYVRVEIAAALKRNVTVIPVLVQGATMPRPEDLPEALKPLARRHALELSDGRWRFDANRLVQVLEKVRVGENQKRVPKSP